MLQPMIHGQFVHFLYLDLFIDFKIQILNFYKKVNTNSVYVEVICVFLSYLSTLKNTNHRIFVIMIESELLWVCSFTSRADCPRTKQAVRF